MVNKIVSIPGYVHLYRSLLRFYHTSENEIKEMLYVLNTANLDCFGYSHPNIYVVQSGPALFSNWLDNMRCRPYRTEVQLYKATRRSVWRSTITVPFTMSVFSVLCRTRTSRASVLCTTGCICRRREGAAVMTTDELKVVFEEQAQRCREVLLQKGMEYTPDEADRFSSFKTAASLRVCSIPLRQTRCWVCSQSTSFLSTT